MAEALTGRPPVWVVLTLVLAPCLPSLLAYNLTPSPTLLNQCLAVGVWGAALVAAGPSLAAGAWRDLRALLGLLALLTVSVAWSWWLGQLPASLAWSAWILLGCAAASAWAGAACGRAVSAPSWGAYFFLGLLLAGILGAMIGIIQVFWPEWTDGAWLARSGLARRAVGNLRQPNHLSSQLVWSLIALAALLELGRLRRVTGILLLPLLVGGVVLTGSRTGMVDMALLAVWALLDRRLARTTRALLLAAPVLYALGWAGMQAWTAADGVATAAARGDISSSRFGIWSNTLALIAKHPWTGVGFGEFNMAWTLTPFPGRPVAFFDHTHNLPLQWLVELGIPIGLGALALLGLAVRDAWRRACAAEGLLRAVSRPALVLVLAILFHSLLEYPLWYAYFLLPAAFAWGLALARPAPVPDPLRPAVTPPAAKPARLLPIAGTLMVVGAGLAVADYRSVVDIFAPAQDAAPLDQRIARGQRSVLFAYHADYAALTTGEPADAAAQDLARRRAPHFLLDARLMMALAQTLAARGELDRARFVADRLREFQRPTSKEFFEACDVLPPEGQASEAMPGAQAEPLAGPPPFQCESATQAHDWRTLAWP